MALLALVSSLLWGTADYIGGVLSRRCPALLVVAVVQVVGLVLAGSLLLLRRDAPFGPYLLLAAGAGAAIAVALSAFYQALAVGTMGVVAPIAATGVAVPVVVSWAQGDRPGALATGGILLAASGVVLASGLDLRHGGASRAAFGLAFLAALGFGSVLVLVDRATSGEGSSTLAVLAVMRATGAVLTIATVALRRTPLTVRRADVPTLVLAGGCDLGAVGLYAVAASGAADLAVVAVLASLYPVVTALLARRLLAERMRRSQVAGVVAALTGVVLIAGSGGAG
ncbi:MAG TPA: EamA family transporter [Mycobacteriales bacterium]|nr:EamA family transporter [Mycobacteriales bacterium]